MSRKTAEVTGRSYTVPGLLQRQGSRVPRSPCDQLRQSLSPASPGPGVHIQSSQIVESSGLYTLQSVLKAQLVKEDRDAQFYCELSYRLPSGNHMKESKEVVVPVFCESPQGPGPGSAEKPGCSPARGQLRAEGHRRLCPCRPGGEGVAGSGAGGRAEGRGPRGGPVPG